MIVTQAEMDERRELHADIRQALAELEMCSEVPALSYEPTARSTTEHPGGGRPPGGIDRKGDREHEWALKSPDHFRRRLAKAHSLVALRAILADAKAALEAAKRAPAPQDKEHPMPGDHNFKRWVAESGLSSSEIARLTGKTGQYIRKVRAQYREKQAA